MKKIQLLLALFLVIFGLLFVVKNVALAGKIPDPGDGCIPPCGSDERCNAKGNCVPEGGGGGGDPPPPPPPVVLPTATPIPTKTPTPIPTATPIPAATSIPCPKKAQGDADCDGGINLMDYFYYVTAVNGGKIPTTVNPDFNSDGKINASDRAIIIKSLKGT